MAKKILIIIVTLLFISLVILGVGNYSGNIDYIQKGYILSTELDNIATTSTLMIIDLSNSNTYPHTYTNYIDLLSYDILLDPNTSFTGEIYLGFLSAVETTTGTINVIKTISLDNTRNLIDITSNCLYGYNCQTSKHYGKTITTGDFKASANINNPTGSGTCNPGNGDLILYTIPTANTIDITIEVIYDTK